jgi:hypothetical protein
MRDDWSEIDMLTALHMRDHESKTLGQIAKKLKRTRSAVGGMFHRYKLDAAFTDEDGNQNGTMKPLWWQEGLRERDRLRKILGLPRENGR